MEEYFKSKERGRDICIEKEHVKKILQKVFQGLINSWGADVREKNLFEYMQKKAESLLDKPKVINMYSFLESIQKDTSKTIQSHLENYLDILSSLLVQVYPTKEVFEKRFLQDQISRGYKQINEGITFLKRNDTTISLHVLTKYDPSPVKILSDFKDAKQKILHEEEFSWVEKIQIQAPLITDKMVPFLEKEGFILDQDSPESNKRLFLEIERDHDTL